MKRQRTAEAKAAKADQGKTTAAMPKKKGKKSAVSKVEEEKGTVDGGDELSPAAAEAVENNSACFEEYWPWLRGVVDEQMSWGLVWLPIWGVEYLVESYGELFSDVAWDDDIWNLKSINTIPNP